MRGLRVWSGLLLLVMLLEIGGQLPTPPATVALAAPVVADNDEQSLEEFVDETIALANTFWAARFRELGKPYRAPKVVKAHQGQRITSECGNSRGSEHSYCGTDETVFLNWDMDTDNDTSFETLWDDDRSLPIVTTIAHEWGHHVQQLLGIFNISDQSVATENQADCLMGVFIASYNESADWVTRADMRDAIEDTRDSGDDPSTPAAERSHGTSDERVEAFMRGYRGKSMASCGITG